MRGVDQPVTMVQIIDFVPKSVSFTIAGDTTAPPKKRVGFSAVSDSGSEQRRRNRGQLRLIERVFENKISP